LFATRALGGCASTSPKAAFDDVAAIVDERTGRQITWDVGSADDHAVRGRLRQLLSPPLTPRSSVQIALLNNKSLQAGYANLGIAQADLVQAGLLSNPILDGAVTWADGGTPNLAFGLTYKFIELLWIPMRKAVAASRLEEAKLAAADLVIDHVGKTHRAFMEYVAARQEVGLFAQVVLSARASVTAAKAIREAGNATELDFEQQQSVLTQSKLDLAQAQVRTAETRERLNVLLGVTGNDTEWMAPGRLPEVSRRELGTSGVERRAISASIELAGLRQNLITLAYKYRLTNKQALIPDLELGGESEREVERKEPSNEAPRGETEIKWQHGPSFEIAIPIFDRGTAKRARAMMEIRQVRDRYWAMAVRIRSEARLARAALLTARKTARYYRQAVLPQRQRLLVATQRQYNAMQEDVFRLITAKRNQIVAGQNYIGALRTYWLARTRFQQLMAGRLPGNGGGAMVVAAAAAGDSEGGH
jgi:cobalt-zinc-cadmium efflux system outer membrane protein